MISTARSNLVDQLENDVFALQKILQVINYIESLSLFDHNAEKREYFLSFPPRDRDEPYILTYSLFNKEVIQQILPFATDQFNS